MFMCMCVYSFSLRGRDQPFLGITGVLFFQTELKPVRKVSADANLKRFQHKVLKARRKPTLNMGEFRVAQTIAIWRCLTAQMKRQDTMIATQNTSALCVVPLVE